MNYWKGLIISLFALSSFITCSSTSGREEESGDNQQAGEWTVTVSGKVLHPVPNSPIYISEMGGASNWLDTIQLKSDNTFSKEVKIKEPGYYKLNFFNAQIINVILDKSDIQVTVDGSDMNGFADIKGSPDLDLIRKANEILQGVQNTPEAMELSKQFEEARQKGDQQKMVALQQQYQELTVNKQEEVADLIKKNPVSLGAINLLQNNTIDKDKFTDTYILVADKLKEKWPDYYHAKNFIDMVEKMKATAIGEPAPEIALPNPEGEIVKLSSMKGKYVLVDFWAKWCGPCRAENPNVVRVYNKYKDKGFTVFGVSLDRNKSDWVNAIKEDGLTWTHVSDLKYWQSEAARTYNINSIPFSVLLDPNGIIIAKNLRGPALEKKLHEILDK